MLELIQPLVTDVYVFLVSSVDGSNYLIEFQPEFEQIKSINIISTNVCNISVHSIPPTKLRLSIWSCFEQTSTGILEHSYADLVRKDYIPQDFQQRFDSNQNNIPRFISKWNKSHGFKGDLGTFQSIFTIM